MGAMTLYKVIILVSLFYSFGITVITHYMPEDSRNFVTGFSDLSHDIDFQSVTDQVESAVTRTADVPIIELGALVFYSGNIILDLLLNFVFAVPEMLAMIIYGIGFIFTLDYFIVAMIQLFASAVFLSLYFISIVEMLAGMRSGNRLV